MRFALVQMTVILLPAIAWPQPQHHVEPPKKWPAFVKIVMKGSLTVEAPINADAQTLSVYEKRTGVMIDNGNDPDLSASFELFLGEMRGLPDLAKNLKNKWVIVYGDLVAVHPPLRLGFFGGGYERPLPGGGHQLPMPRLVIKVGRLQAAEEDAPKDHLAFVKVEVQGVLETNGTNASLDQINAGKAMPTSLVRSDPCDFRLFLGKKR